MSYVKNIEHSIVIKDISCTEVKQVISTLKNSSAGWDEVPTFVAKKCEDDLYYDFSGRILFVQPMTRSLLLLGFQ